jgi:hypothetical protein
MRSLLLVESLDFNRTAYKISPLTVPLRFHVHSLLHGSVYETVARNFIEDTKTKR